MPARGSRGSMLSHVDEAGRPTMVDVGDKAVTVRTAEARALVVFPDDAPIEAGEALRTKKGPVFDTAVIAGVMAAKKTHELIPFCHPLPLESCKIAIDWSGPREVLVRCAVRATHKTGVEMEALTGASVAALTIYDMCKALTHGVRIREVALVSKTGGKHDYRLRDDGLEQADAIGAGSPAGGDAHGEDAQLMRSAESEAGP